MNTRFRRPLQAAALLFSLSLFIGYLWSTQRRSGLPSVAALPPAQGQVPPSEKTFVETEAVPSPNQAVTVFKDLIDYHQALGPKESAKPKLMPGSKSFSQPLFSMRTEPSPAPNPMPVMPSSKVGIFSLPNLSIHLPTQAPIMSSSKSGAVHLPLPAVIDPPEKTTP